MDSFDLLGLSRKKKGSSSMDEILGLEGHKPKKQRRPIDKNVKDAVWVKYIGNKMEGKCYCCRMRPIHITDFEVGHNKAVAKGGTDHISNLRPICRKCNSGMGTISIEKYKETHFGIKRSKKPSEEKTKKKRRTRTEDNGNYWINPLTGKKEKLGFF